MVGEGNGGIKAFLWLPLSLLSLLYTTAAALHSAAGEGRCGIPLELLLSLHIQLPIAVTVIFPALIPCYSNRIIKDTTPGPYSLSLALDLSKKYDIPKKKKKKNKTEEIIWKCFKCHVKKSMYVMM